MDSANLHEFSTENWQSEVLDSDQPVVVDFWAPWCGPCRLLTPIIAKLADQFAGKVKVGKLNVDDNQDIAARYRISGIPQVFLFKAKSQEPERLIGLRPEAELVKAINHMLGE